MRRAFAVATSGRPGPVVVDVPEDICHGTHGFDEDDFSIDPAHGAAPALRCRPGRRRRSSARPHCSPRRKRPLILAGGGVHISGAAEALTAFARALNIPVAHTMTGKGAIPCIDPLSAGLFGRYDRIANALIAEADLLLVVGCKLGEIATKRYTVPPQGKRIIHLDIVAEEFGRTLAAGARAVGRCARRHRATCTTRWQTTPSAIRTRQASYAAEVPRRMAQWRAGVSRAAAHRTKCRSAMGRLHERDQPALPADGYPGRRRRLRRALGRACCSTPSGPAAASCPIAASPRSATACPARWASRWRRRAARGRRLTGDGGFNMMLGELETARRLALDLHDRRRQQRRLGLRQGAAAPDVRRRAATTHRTWRRPTMRRPPRRSAAPASAVETPDQMGPALERASQAGGRW